MIFTETNLKGALSIAKKLGRPDLILLGALPAPANEPRLLVANPSRLFHEVSWCPKYDLDQGIMQSIGWRSNDESE
jgi:nucleoside-diphosphate-sugar epimerase